MKKLKKPLCLFITAVMMLAFAQLSQAVSPDIPADTGKRLDNAIVLYIGSSEAFVNNIQTHVDASNPEVRPYIKNSRTLVPVRFISEALGARVGWDAGTSTATVTLGAKSIKLTLGSSKMTAGNVQVPLEAAAESVNGRIFIPLRSLAEALGKKVFYNKGLIVISDMENIFDPVTDKALIDETISRVNNLPVVGSFENLKHLIEQSSDYRMYITRSLGIIQGISSDQKAADAEAPAAESKSGAGSSDYSTTNVQVKGVDEADIVKTDGEYIYQVNRQRIVVTRAYPAGSMKVESIVDFTDTGFSPQELYLDGQRLVVIGSSFKNIPVPMPKDGLKEDTKMAVMPSYYANYTAKAMIYDIADKSKLKKLREVELDGTYVSSRKIGSALYLVTDSNAKYYTLQQQSENVTPAYRDTAVKDAYIRTGYDSIRYFPGMVQSNYMMVAGLNLDRPDEAMNVSTYLGAGENIYVSPENLYVAVTNYNMENDGRNTLVYKFSLNSGKTTYLCRGEVPGTILNQFSMDEYSRWFRIATTRGDVWRNDAYASENNVYVLDEMLNITGKIEGIAPGERIYSVRFMGDRGYVVTFRTMDPLFVIDLKNPEKPGILGALKIPGYSDYLQPYDENHIIGFGKDTIELPQKDWQGNVMGSMAYYLGMKIAIFDITDVSKPVELFSQKIGDRGTDSELLRNHKALLFDKDKGLLAFPLMVMEVKNKQVVSGDMPIPQYGEFTFQGAYVYHVDLEHGFTLKGTITHISDEEYLKAGSYWYDDNKYVERIIYIGDTLYTLSKGMIKATSMENLKELNRVNIP